jgi:DNA-binding CsgD family transcriptional regulator
MDRKSLPQEGLTASGWARFESRSVAVSLPFSAPIPHQLRRNRDRTRPQRVRMVPACRNWNADLFKRALDHNELEALTLFANGKSADEIAAALNVSQGMAHHYLRVAARKLGARNRVHAVAVAVRNGLIKPTGGED